MPTITTLIITHKYGTNVYPCTTPQIANAYLYDFVKRWWAEVFKDEPIPTEESEAIEEYFNSDICLESYDIDTSTLLEKPPVQ